MAVTKMRIIIADDMPMHVRELYESIHANWPEWEILTAGDGQEIVRQVSSSHVDIILSDIRMPKMDGLEMLSVVKQISPQTKIVFITAYPLFEYAQKALKLGATDFLLKPVETAALFDLLARLSSDQGNGNGLADDLRQWLEQDWDSLAPEVRRRIGDCCARGCICAVAAPATDPFPQPPHLAEHISRAAGCTVLAADVFSTPDSRLYALVCTSGSLEGDSFFQAVQKTSLRYGFRAGLSAWSDQLPRQGHELWLAARAGAERAFYTSAGVVRFEEPYSFRDAEFPFAQKVLSWMAEAGNWQAEVQRLVDGFARTRPDSADLIRNTRHVIRDCCKMLTRDDVDAPSTPIGSELKMVTFFSEYRVCLENAMAQIEKLYQQNISRADPVDTAMAYVRKHYMDPITLTDMAEMTHLSPNYFSTLFRKRTSMRFMEYVLQVRLEKASEMLANTEMYVYEIANACGYEDVRYFVRVYQKAYGISPANFRRCFRKDKPGE